MSTKAQYQHNLRNGDFRRFELHRENDIPNVGEAVRICFAWESASLVISSAHIRVHCFMWVHDAQNEATEDESVIWRAARVLSSNPSS
jgi:hypothetical protein